MSEIAICIATLLGDPFHPHADEVRMVGQAARSAGFTEASVWAPHLLGLTGVGLRIGVVEAALAWANGEANRASAEAERLASLAAEYDAPLIGAACVDGAIHDLALARRNLVTVVNAAAQIGARVCLEFLPGTGIPDLASAWSLVEPLGPSATILLDSWHWTRQQTPQAFEVLAAIPGERIGCIQVSDAAAVAASDVVAEGMTARLLPGEGVVDFPSLFSALEGIGAEPYRAVEVFNPGLVRQYGVAASVVAMRDAALRTCSTWP